MSTQDNGTTPVVRHGPAKDIWDEALKRSGIEPSEIAEYNVPDDCEHRPETPSPLGK